jgi:hypothetical protein
MEVARPTFASREGFGDIPYINPNDVLNDFRKLLPILKFTAAL